MMVVSTETSPALLARIADLEASLYAHGSRQVSRYARNAFCRFFRDGHHDTHHHLMQYIQNESRSALYMQSQELVPKAIQSTERLNNIDGLEMKLKKYEKAKEDVEAKRLTELAGIKGQLRDEWEILQTCAALSVCGSDKTVKKTPANTAHSNPSIDRSMEHSHNQ